MASSSSSSFIIALTISLSIFITLITPSSSLTCASQKLPSNRKYTNCTDLPALGATLHFTYNNTNGSISVAFAAEPSTKDGWISWGINPSGGGMVGTQSLIAYKTNGNVGVYLYNLTAYSKIDAVKTLSVETWDVAAEETNGVITIFAGVKLPEKMDNISQVWQVGPVAGGKPMKHEFKQENLNAVTKFSVDSTAVSNTTTGNGTAAAPSPSDEKKNGAVRERNGLGFYFGFVLVLLSLIM